jgi:hypothetical protein
VRVQEWEDANQRRPIHRYRGSHRRLVRLRGRRSRRRDQTCLTDPSGAPWRGGVEVRPVRVYW